jgi:hypothetical protein
MHLDVRGADLHDRSIPENGMLHTVAVHEGAVGRAEVDEVDVSAVGADPDSELCVAAGYAGVLDPDV